MSEVPVIKTTILEETTPDGLAAPDRYWAAFAIAVGIILSVIDGTAVNLALPIIAGEFHISAAQSILVVNSYQLVMAMSLLPLATLGDYLGYRRIFVGGFVLFVVASLFCALADSLLSLTLARAFQGLGGAGIISVASAMVRRIYPANMLGRGLGINAMVVAGSTAAGPSIAAAILSLASWQWIFIINIPIGVFGLIVSWRKLPANHALSGSFDWRSGVLSALSVGSLLLFVEALGHGQQWPVLLVILVFVVLISIIFVRRQLRTEEPMLPVDLLAAPLFSLSVITAIFSFAAQMIAIVSLPFFLSSRLGLDIVSIGVLFSGWPLAVMCMSVLAGRLADKYQAGILGGIGLVIGGTGLYLLSALGQNPQSFDVIWRMAICGLGFGLFQTPNTRLIVAFAPISRAGSVSGMVGTTRLMGQTIGASLAAFMLYKFSESHGHSALLLAVALSAIAVLFSLARLLVKR